MDACNRRHACSALPRQDPTRLTREARAQVCTQSSSSRPFGVGLLVAGVDQTGPHIYYNCPSGNYFEYKAMTIGARSQAAKTYLEKHFETFADCDLQARPAP